MKKNPNLKFGKVLALAKKTYKNTNKSNNRKNKSRNNKQNKSRNNRSNRRK